MRQQTLAAQTGFEKYGRKSKRERFLDEMEQVVPWAELEALIERHYPKGENGRPPVGLSIMLRVYFLQQWFNLSDPGTEEALYESPAIVDGSNFHPFQLLCHYVQTLGATLVVDPFQNPVDHRRSGP